MAILVNITMVPEPKIGSAIAIKLKIINKIPSTNIHPQPFM